MTIQSRHTCPTCDSTETHKSEEHEWMKCKCSYCETIFSVYMPSTEGRLEKEEGDKG